MQPVYMDIYREKVQQSSAETAPNGEPKSFYGTIGSETSDSFQSLRDVHHELFSQLLIPKGMDLLMRYISEPSRKVWHWVFGGKFEPSEIFTSTTLYYLAKVAECLTAIVTLIAAVVLLDVVRKTAYQLAIMAAFCLLFALEYLFISPSAHTLYLLIAG